MTFTFTPTSLVVLLPANRIVSAAELGVWRSPRLAAPGAPVNANTHERTNHDHEDLAA